MMKWRQEGHLELEKKTQKEWEALLWSSLLYVLWPSVVTLTLDASHENRRYLFYRSLYNLLSMLIWWCLFDTLWWYITPMEYDEKCARVKSNFNYSQASNSWFGQISGTGAWWRRRRTNNGADVIPKLLTDGYGRALCPVEINQNLIFETKCTFCNMPALHVAWTLGPWVHSSPAGRPAAPAGWSKVCLTPAPGCLSSPLALSQLTPSAVKTHIQHFSRAWGLNLNIFLPEW